MERISLNWGDGRVFSDRFEGKNIWGQYEMKGWGCGPVGRVQGMVVDGVGIGLHWNGSGVGDGIGLEVALVALVTFGVAWWWGWDGEHAGITHR